MNSIDLKKELQARPGSKIIRASEHKVWQTADERLEAATKILETVTEEKSKAHEAAKADGYAAGLEQGKSEALSLVNEMQLTIADRLVEVEQKMIELSRWVIEQTLGSISISDRLKSVIQSQLSSVAAPVIAIVYVSPAELDDVRNDVFQNAEGEEWTIDFRADPELQTGQAEIMIGGYRFDASVETLARNLHHDLVRASQIK